MLDIFQIRDDVEEPEMWIHIFCFRLEALTSQQLGTSMADKLKVLKLMFS